jgi:NADPH-dependent ferric siderophore reductase
MTSTNAPSVVSDQVDGTGGSAAAAPAAVEVTIEQPDAKRADTVHGRVSAVEQVRRGLLQVTLAGFGDVVLEGGDEFVYVMVAHDEGSVAGEDATGDRRGQADGGPVRGAYYTVRRARPEVGEIDLWVVEHDHPGSVGAWMMAAGPGAPLALRGPRRGFQVPDDADHVLFVADETGLAAVAALVEVLPPGRTATAVLESRSPECRPVMPGHPGLGIVWVDRGGGARNAGP